MNSIKDQLKAAFLASDEITKIEPTAKPEPIRIPSVLSQFRFRSDRPMIARSALGGIGRSLNFSIVGLVAAHLRSLKFGEAIPDADEHFGHTLDQRNEIDLGVEGDAVEKVLREEQGFDTLLKPLDLAARLKVIRDSCASELSAHAGMRRNPIDGSLYKNPYDLVASIAESLSWQLKQTARVNDSTVHSLSMAVGIDEQSIRIMLEEQHETQQRFLKDNAAEIFTTIDNLVYKAQDGHPFGITDDETVEDRLPAINRARLFVAADKGLVTQRKALVKAVGNGRRSIDEAAGDFGLVDGERNLLHAKFHTLMALPFIKDEIEDAVQRGAKRPVLLPLFAPVVVKKVGLAA